MAAGVTARFGRVSLIALLVAATAGCGSGSSRPTFPPVGSTPGPVGAATSGARAAVTAALAVEGLQVVDATVPYRPAEGALFAAAPRSVIQVTLPQDPTHGFVVLYALESPQAAFAAATDQASYLATGPGRIQFPPDTRFSLRVLDSTAIFFSWSADSPDPGSAAVDLALSQIGIDVPIPS